MRNIEDFITTVSLDRKAFEELRAKVEAFDRIKDVAMLDIKGISKIQDYNYHSLHKNRKYILPGFGKPLYGTVRKRYGWTVAEYLAWESIPEEQRKSEFERLTNEGAFKEE